ALPGGAGAGVLRARAAARRPRRARPRLRAELDLARRHGAAQQDRRGRLRRLPPPPDARRRRQDRAGRAQRRPSLADVRAALMLQAAADYCRKLTARSRSNFYFAFLFLPKHKREALYAVYAFCRLVDDAADDAA